MAAFLADPKPFIDGTRDLAEIVGTAAVAPLATAIGNNTNWTFLFSLLILLITGWIVWMWRIRRPRSQSGQSIGP
jgi:predicted MFS family arabinose efflux permease